MKLSRDAAASSLWERGTSSSAASREPKRSRKRLMINLGAAALIPAVAVWFLPEMVGALRAAPVSPAAIPSPTEVPVMTTPHETSLAGTTRSYAISITELQGFPSDAVPGTRFELWVAWDPPITPRPRFQRLVRDVVLERVIPPLTANGPTAAMLEVPEARISDLLYADRYGALSVLVAR